MAESKRGEAGNASNFWSYTRTTKPS